jgi:hypothetical protein
MAITKEQAIDILDKFDFFQGQRAGRELWNGKPYEVQEEDIKAFSRDVAELKAYIADVVPKSEVEAMQRMYDEKLDVAEARIATLNKPKTEVAREIFEEIEKALSKMTRPSYVTHIIAELEKKYTEGVDGTGQSKDN